MDKKKIDCFLFFEPITEEKFKKSLPYQIIIFVILMVILISLSYINDKYFNNKKESKEVQKTEQNLEVKYVY
ncbi:MAG: hypothetical protein M0Q13_02595 [Methanothrix sp.]|jgi:hypothetical protein|nr:hypothetical protein [Methanothrix sp.]